MIFKTIYKSNLNRSQAVNELKESASTSDLALVDEITRFILKSNRGLA